ncbi:MAG: hypothetical protein KA257_06695 [Opitutaceae bacterium]|nr:hypothetical protein [Opitutaceae bacterium]
MPITARAVPVADILPWREQLRQEAQSQIANDSLHSRPGWTQSDLLEIDTVPTGYPPRRHRDRPSLTKLIAALPQRT